VPRLEDVAIVAGRDDAVDLAEGHRRPVYGAGRGEVLQRHVTARVERFPVHEREVGARGAEIGEPRPTVDVLSEVDHLASGIEARDRNRSQFEHASHGRRR
jgi:hypothetical protein